MRKKKSAHIALLSQIICPAMNPSLQRKQIRDQLTSRVIQDQQWMSVRLPVTLCRRPPRDAHYRASKRVIVRNTYAYRRTVRHKGLHTRHRISLAVSVSDCATNLAQIKGPGVPRYRAMPSTLTAGIIYAI